MSAMLPVDYSYLDYLEELKLEEGDTFKIAISSNLYS